MTRGMTMDDNFDFAQWAEKNSSGDPEEVMNSQDRDGNIPLVVGLSKAESNEDIIPIIERIVTTSDCIHAVKWDLQEKGDEPRSMGELVREKFSILSKASQQKILDAQLLYYVRKNKVSDVRDLLGLGANFSYKDDAGQSVFDQLALVYSSYLKDVTQPVCRTILRLRSLNSHPHHP